MADSDRYTMTAGKAAKLLGMSREGLHTLAERGDLSFKAKPRGAKRWKFFDPEEVERLVVRREGDEPEVA